jgi:hypothetical protein
MTNDLTIAKDSIDDALGMLSAVRGMEIKYTTEKDWTQGYDGESAGEVGDLVFVEAAEGWRFLLKSHPMEFLLREPGKPRPPRPDTHTDKNSWTVYNDEARDPWNYVGILHFISIATGTTYNYIVSTVGGKRARDELFEQIRSMRQMAPGALPIVRLGSTSMKTGYGTRQRPMFKIAGWQKPKSNGNKQIEAQAAEIETIDNPFDDEVGF